MNRELTKINSVVEKYGISSRTLRYYEEMGLINSVRTSSTQSRLYDQEALNRLKHIIILKQIGLSIDEIRGVLQSPESAIFVCRCKLQRIEDTEGILSIEKLLLQAFIRLLESGSCSLAASIENLLQEVDDTKYASIEQSLTTKKKESYVMKKLSNEEVRLINLNPMRVACYNAISEHPENDAVETIMKWAVDNGIDKMPHSRYFGYNTNIPAQDNPAYGYEFCVTIEDDIKVEAPITVKTIAGGLYAVSSLYGQDIPVAWERLMEWIASSSYEPEWPKRQCLEEHFPSNKGKLDEDIFQLDLFEPIKVR